MSGTCTFLLKSILEDISIDLKNSSCIQYEEDNSLLLIGMQTGEIIVLKLQNNDGKVSLLPNLFLSPSFQSDNNPLVAMTVAEMPFSLMTVKTSH